MELHPTPPSVHKIVDPTRRRKTCAVIASGAAAIVAISGCRGPLDGGPVQADPERLRAVEPIDLDAMSRTPPVSVDDASAQALEQVVAPKLIARTLQLELSEVRAAALHNNLELGVELFNPTIAQTFVREEEARFESTFFGNAGRSKQDAPTPTLTEASQATANNYDLGVRIPMRTGGTVVVDVPLSDLTTNDVFATLNPSYQAALQFSISQPLLRNAGFAANTNGIRVANLQAQISEAQTKLSAIRILAAADKAYWALYAARRELEVRQQRYELAVDQLERAKRLVAAGTSAEVEVIRAQSGVADSLNGIIVAETSIKIRQRDLKRILNREDLPMGGPTEVLTVTDPSPMGLDLDAEALAERAVANRMEMLELELQLAIDASNLAFQRNQALPLFVIDYTYSRDGLNDNYGSALRQTVDQSFENWQFNARMEIPLGNEAAKARVARAVLTRVQRLGTRDQRRQVIRQEVFDALDRLEENWQRILAARQATLLAARTYEAEKRQFELGLRTSTDVLDATARLADAQSIEVRALADYQVAQVDIAFATGTLLGSGRVEWSPAAMGSDR